MKNAPICWPRVTFLSRTFFGPVSCFVDVALFSARTADGIEITTNMKTIFGESRGGGHAVSWVLVRCSHSHGGMLFVQRLTFWNIILCVKMVIFRLVLFVRYEKKV